MCSEHLLLKYTRNYNIEDLKHIQEEFPEIFKKTHKKDPIH